jgi:hypothetical protein
MADSPIEPVTATLERDALFSVALALATLAGYVIITNVLTRVRSVSPADDMLGGMWAVVGMVFVARTDFSRAAAHGRTRLFASVVGTALCFLYLLWFPVDA